MMTLACLVGCAFAPWAFAADPVGPPTIASEEARAKELLERVRQSGKPVPRICHHRGATRFAPENSLQSLDHSIRLGADFIELDIRTSKDGVPFLLHDRTLERTTTAKGPIAWRTAGELKEVMLRPRPDQGEPEPIPTLDDFLTHVGDKIELYIDAKEIAPAALVEALKKHGLIDRSIVYQGADYLEELRALEPKLRRMPPLDSAEEIDGLVERVAPYAFDADWKILSVDLIERCHTRGVKVFSDALGWHERGKDYRQAAVMGLDVIQTDWPLRVLESLAPAEPAG